MRVAPAPTETPAARRQRMVREGRQRALETLQNDPNVRVLLSEFDGELDTASVEPLAPGSR